MALFRTLVVHSFKKWLSTIHLKQRRDTMYLPHRQLSTPIIILLLLLLLLSIIRQSQITKTSRHRLQPRFVVASLALAHGYRARTASTTGVVGVTVAVTTAGITGLGPSCRQVWPRARSKETRACAHSMASLSTSRRSSLTNRSKMGRPKKPPRFQR